MTSLDSIPVPADRVLVKCPWRNPAQWVVWSDRVIRGQLHSFTHLLPFDMSLSRPAKGKFPAMSVDIRVVFDCHVVTESYSPAVHACPEPEEVWRDAGNALRVFHADRHRLSLGLPDMLKEMVAPGNNPRCFETNRSNFMILERQSSGEGTEYYHVFFDLYPSPRIQGQGCRLIMYVQSAYVKNLPLRERRTDSTLFAAICSKKLGL